MENKKGPANAEPDKQDMAHTIQNLLNRKFDSNVIVTLSYRNPIALDSKTFFQWLQEMENRSIKAISAEETAEKIKMIYENNFWTKGEARKMDNTQETSKKEITNEILNEKIRTAFSDYLDTLDCRIQATKRNHGANLAEINDGIRVINHIVQIMARTSTLNIK